MPMIRVTLPSGLLQQAQRESLAEDLSAAIMKVETGGEDTPGFHAITALILDEIPPAAWTVGGQFASGPSAIVEIRVPKDTLDPERRKAMVAASYEVLVGISPELAEADGVRRIWTHLVEIEDWGVGGRIVSLADVVQVASSPTAELLPLA